MAKFFLLFSLLSCLLATTPARAQPGGPVRADARLLLNTDKLQPGQQAIAAIVVDIDEGYHAQSSQPLDPALIPFVVTLTGSDGRVTILDPLYPPGHIEDFPALGGKLSVYTGRVIAFVPFTVAADAAAGEVELKATVSLQLCNDQTCDMPADIPLSVKTQVATAGEPMKTINDAIFKQLDPLKWLNKHPTSDAQSATTQSASTATNGHPDWIPYSDAALAEARKSGKPVVVKFTASWCVNCHVVERRVFGDAATVAELSRRGVTLIKTDLTSDGAPGSELLASLNTSRSIPFTAVFLPGKDEPVELTGIYSSADLLGAIEKGQGNAWDFSDFPLPAQLGIALLVGIVLNVVPCVLPVLPLKAMSFYEDAGHDRRRSVLNGSMFSLGIIATFGALAIFVITQSALWGKFISHPITAVILVVVLLAAAAQAMGLFEFRLPDAVTNLDGSTEGSTLAGNFFGGVLIAILSTPCTVGPFAGIIAVAITLGLPLGPLILMFVGVGMALPWLVLSAFPEATRRFPRTGPWPLVVKQMTAFLLVATAIFFAAPLMPTTFREHALWWLIFACVAASALFLLARTVQIAPRARPIAISSVVALLLVSLGLTLALAFNA